HYVSLDRTPELYAKLSQDDITLREACGNTVRNVTASQTAGIDPRELFDVTPYANAVTNYFLRNPICQEMGRKFKIAFSSSEEDRAALKNKSYPISGETTPPSMPVSKGLPAYEIKDVEKYQAWLKTNVFEQKQKDYFAAYVRVTLGDIDTKRARILVHALQDY